MKDKQKGLAQQKIASAKQAIEDAQKAAAREVRIAEAYDKHIEEKALTIPEPTRIYTGFKLYGSDGSITWEDMTPGDAVSIMEAFPPVPSGLVKTYSTGYKPESAYKDDEKPTAKPGCGYTFRVDKYAGHDSVKAEWYAEVDGELLHLTIQFRQIWGVLPRIAARVTTAPYTGDVVKVENCRIEWGVEPPSQLNVIRYASGGMQYFNPFLVWGDRCDREENSPIVETVREWARVCYEKRENSRRAYLEDKATGLPPAVDNSKPYERDTLRAGTKAQWEALHTEEALKDRALAEKHWKMYAEDNNIETRQGYFDHYAWACSWLERHNLNPDPNGPEGKPYKYGSAWL